jgi:hypothetical protein
LKKGKPENGYIYRLIGGPDEPSILRGDEWKDCKVGKSTPPAWERKEKKGE